MQASIRFLSGQSTLLQKVKCSHVKIAEEAQSTIFCTNLLLIFCKIACNAVFADPTSTKKTSFKQQNSTFGNNVHTKQFQRLQKSTKHCFWYQKGLNKIQICLDEHGNHNTKCKKSIFTKFNDFTPISSTKIAKKSTALLLVPIMTKTVTELFFSPSMSMKTTKLVACNQQISTGGNQPISKNSNAVMYRLPKKVQSTIFGTKMLQICCSCKIACNAVFAALTSKG